MFATLTLRQQLGLRLLALASAAVVLASAAPRLACAQPATATAATATSLKLFPDSRLITRDRISVEVVGSGPDIVMIPGLASTRETWRRTAERLRGRYRLHLVQLAGFGGEPARANASGPVFDPTLADIDGYLATLKKPPIVMGHSLGGTLGLALAERHPEHLSRLLVVDALPFYGVLMGGPAATVDSVRPIADGMLRTGAGMGSPERQRAMIASMVTAPADVDRVLGWGARSDRAVVMQAMRDDMLTDLRPGLAEITTPTTVLYPWDPSLGVPERAFDAVYKGGYAPAKAVRLVRVDGSRHFIMYDQPARFDAEVDGFLKEG